MFALSAGTQYQLTNAASVRMGYSYNTNPISDSQSFFNVGSPLVIQHGVYAGTSYNLTSRFKVSIAYSHFFENSVSGPLYAPGLGAVPGSNIKSSASADSVLIGASFNY
jgi:long-chain fatty acid transport protein